MRIILNELYRHQFQNFQRGYFWDPSPTTRRGGVCHVRVARLESLARVAPSLGLSDNLTMRQSNATCAPSWCAPVLHGARFARFARFARPACKAAVTRMDTGLVASSWAAIKSAGNATHLRRAYGQNAVGNDERASHALRVR